MVVCLERGADLHTAPLMPLPLIVSYSSKIQIGFTFLVPAHPGRLGQTAVKRVCVCVGAGSTTANPQQQHAGVDRSDREMDGHHTITQNLPNTT